MSSSQADTHKPPPVLEHSNTSSNVQQGQFNQSPSAVNNLSQLAANKAKPSLKDQNGEPNSETKEKRLQSSDALEKARAAIAAAERASAAARAAAELVNFKFGSVKLEQAKS